MARRCLPGLQSDEVTRFIGHQGVNQNFDAIHLHETLQYWTVVVLSPVDSCCRGSDTFDHEAWFRNCVRPQWVAQLQGMAEMVQHAFHLLRRVAQIGFVCIFSGSAWKKPLTTSARSAINCILKLLWLQMPLSGIPWLSLSTNHFNIKPDLETSGHLCTRLYINCAVEPPHLWKLWPSAEGLPVPCFRDPRGAPMPHLQRRWQLLQCRQGGQACWMSGWRVCLITCQGLTNV